MVSFGQKAGERSARSPFCSVGVPAAAVLVFIEDPETVRPGALFPQGRCFAIPFMRLGFRAVHFMQAGNRGKVSFLRSVICHLVRSIPALILFSALFGTTCRICFRVHRHITAPRGQDPAPIE